MLPVTRLGLRSITKSYIPTVKGPGPARSVPRFASTMSASATDEIVKQLFDRPLPLLEPGTTVYDQKLVGRIAKLPEHMFVVAGAYTSGKLFCRRRLIPTAIHLANDDIHHAHLIAQDNEGVS
jgi:hypothetical protein